jgi:hypothetical protein
MISNPLTGDRHPFMEYPGFGIESPIVNSSITITIAIFCIVGPFWLIYRLAKQAAKTYRT